MYQLVEFQCLSYIDDTWTLSADDAIETQHVTFKTMLY